MRDWMRSNKVAAMLLVLVLSPLLIPAMLIYVFLDTTLEVLNLLLEQAED